MKKTTTTLGVIASLLIIIGIILKIQHLFLAGPLIVLGFTLLIIFFLPVFGYHLVYDFTENKSKLAGVLGAIMFALIALAAIFKIQHWQGSPFVLILEFFVLCFLLLPVLMIHKIKTATTKTEKYLQAAWYISLMLLMLGYGHKLQHFPGAAVLLISGTVIIALLYIPLAVKLYNNDEKRKKLYNRLVIIVSILVYVMLTTAGTSSAIMESFVNIDDGINESIKSPQEKLKMMYGLIEMINKNETKTQDDIALYYPKEMKVKEISDAVYNHIEKLKNYLLNEVQKSNNDSITLAQLNAKDNVDVPSHILVGNPENPNKGAWSAAELKAKIFVFKQDILSMYEQRTKDVKQSTIKTIGMNMDDTFSKEGSRTILWEEKTFYNLPIAAVISILSKIQLDIKTNELATLQYLYTMSRKAGIK